MTLTAANYNTAQIAAGSLRPDHIVELVRHWQSTHGLPVDGMAGPRTLATIRSLSLACPLPVLPGGRRATITSEFRPADRPNHNGVDFFYPWQPGDQPAFVGDKGCAGKTASGAPKWGVPYGTHALAAASGVVTLAGHSPTGYRVWIDHGGGLRTGYFHLLDCLVLIGQSVAVGANLGLVGDNPADHDGRHLHFELSSTEKYDPMDPAPFMVV